MHIYYTGYITTNLINNKKYIGVHQTTNPYDRYLGSGNSIVHAIRKYGRHNFHKSVIAFMLNAEVMFEWEAENVTQEIVDDPMYYNLRTGGLGGVICSEQTRKNMSRAQSNRSRNTRDKISIANKGKKVTQETRQKIRRSLTGKNRPSPSIETRNKMSKSHMNNSSILGHGQTDEAKRKISIALRGRKKPKSPEWRANISTALKKYWAEKQSLIFPSS